VPPPREYDVIIHSMINCLANNYNLGTYDLKDDPTYNRTEYYKIPAYREYIEDYLKNNDLSKDAKITPITDIQKIKDLNKNLLKYNIAQINQLTNDEYSIQMRKINDQLDKDYKLFGPSSDTTEVPTVVPSSSTPNAEPTTKPITPVRRKNAMETLKSNYNDFKRSRFDLNKYNLNKYYEKTESGVTFGLGKLLQKIIKIENITITEEIEKQLSSYQDLIENKESTAKYLESSTNAATTAHGGKRRTIKKSKKTQKSRRRASKKSRRRY